MNVDYDGELKENTGLKPQPTDIRPCEALSEAELSSYGAFYSTRLSPF